MIGSESHIPQTEIAGRLQKLMFLRVLFVSFLLGASIFIQVKQTQTYFGPIQTSHYFLIAAIYFLTFLYVILLKILRHLVRLAYIQLLMDTALVTAIIYSTGGIDSIFSFLYILTIINGSMILYRRGGLLLATVSSLFYGILLILHYFGIIHPFGSRMLFPAEFQGGYILYTVTVNSVAFFLVAFLATFLSEQLRKSRVELRAKQKDLLKLEVLNERIIRSIASGLITVDDKARIILFNPAAEGIFGIRAGESIGRKITEALPVMANMVEDNPASSDLPSSMPGGIMDLTFKRPDGREVFLRLSMSPLNLSDGGAKGQILVIQDMTEIRQIEDEMKRMEGLALVGELAAGIAHEIRNPMASISGSIQMLKESLAQENVNQRLMDIVLREINRLNSLVGDFLLFARPKPANYQSLNLKEVVLDSLERFRNSDQWKTDIQVETHLADPITLQSDPEKIRQVLWNLFLNASEAMEEGGGTLTVEAEMMSHGNRHTGVRHMAKIVIRDTGKGFSKEVLEHLFTPFFTTKDKRSGLGLAIVKRIVEGLNGHIYGKNHPEGGAVVDVLLPLTQS